VTLKQTTDAFPTILPTVEIDTVDTVKEIPEAGKLGYRRLRSHIPVSAALYVALIPRILVAFWLCVILVPAQVAGNMWTARTHRL